MKRFLVTDLFHGDKNLDEGDWVDAKLHLPKEKDGIYKVKLKDGDETTAYYYQDKILSQMDYYKDKPSHWWHKGVGSPLYNVTHWKGVLIK